MSGTTSATGPAGPEPRAGTGPEHRTGPGSERGPVTVAEAARVLGISERAVRKRIAAIRDEWLAPLVERIGALERENGDLAGQLASRAGVLAAKDETIAELRRRAEAAEEERDALRARLAAATTPRIVTTGGQGTTEAPPATETTSDAHRPVQGLWRRLRRRLAGG